MKLLTIFLFSFNLYANYTIKKIDLEHGTFKIARPSGWQMLESMRGHDLTLYGPQKKEGRSVVIIQHSTVNQWDVEQEKNSTALFLKNKKDWVKKKGGQFLGSELAKQIPFIKKNHIQNTYTFSRNRKVYMEAKLTIQCSKKLLLNITYLTLKKEFPNFKRDWQTIIKRSSCY